MITEPFDFPRHALREYRFAEPKCHLRVMFVDEGIEVYVNNEFLLATKLPNLGQTHAGLFVDRGKAVIDNLEIYRVED